MNIDPELSESKHWRTERVFYSQWDHGMAAIIQFLLFAPLLNNWIQLLMSGSPLRLSALSWCIFSRLNTTANEWLLWPHKRRFDSNKDVNRVVIWTHNPVFDPPSPHLLNSNTASPPVCRASCWFQCERELQGLISAHVCSWKLFTAFFTPPQRQLHTFHCSMQPYFGSWDALIDSNNHKKSCRSW